MKRLYLFAFTLLCTSTLAFGALGSMRVLHLRSMSMGDAYTAIADDYHVLSVNPAGLAIPKGQRGVRQSAFELGANINGELVDFAMNMVSNTGESGFIGQMTAEGGDPMSMLGDPAFMNFIDELMRTKVNFGLTGPFYIAMNFNHFGIALINSMDMSMVLHRNILPMVKIDMHANLQVKAGLGFELNIGPFKLDVGGAVKAFGYADYGHDFGVGDVGSNIMNGDISAVASALEDLKIGYGFGVDAGAIFYLTKNLRFAAVVEDLFTPVFLLNNSIFEMAGFDPTTLTNQKPVEFIAPNIKLGVAYSIPKILFLPEFLISDLTLAGDFKHMLHPFLNGDYPNFFMMLHLGAEVKLINRIFSVRAGLNQGYFTCGIGVNLGPLEMNYAFYQEELGRAIGDVPATTHLVNFAIRFGDRKPGEGKKKKDKDDDE